jgi:ornithine carbamoyltransferase
LRDFDPATLRQMLDVAAHYKKARGVASRPLTGKTLALIFEKPSTRTRVSFEVGMRQLGGDVIVLSAADMQISRGETAADTARVLSRYVDAIMLRTDRWSRLHELAEYATVPVINGLTDTSHPCQLMADVLTFRGTPRSDRRSGRGLVRRRQQRRPQLDRGGGAVRFHAAPRHPRRRCARPRT